VISTMQIWRLPIGMQDIAQGALILAVLAVSQQRRRGRS
jgi:ribose/xylose/arabinose/galactoside ABC-type transport system permease subunit